MAGNCHPEWAEVGVHIEESQQNITILHDRFYRKRERKSGQLMGDLRVRFRVEKMSAPPGLVSLASVAANSRGPSTCSMTSDAITASYCPPVAINF